MANEADQLAITEDDAQPVESSQLDESAAQDEMPYVYKGEAQLAGWADSHRSGATVTLFLPNSEALEKFRGMTTRKGNKAGQMLALAIIEVNDVGEPIPQSGKNGDKNKLEGTVVAVERKSDVENNIKPYGQEAQKLYIKGFFNNPRLQARLGITIESSEVASERAKLTSKALAKEFGLDSVGDVDPTLLYAWCDKYGFVHALPDVYKDAGQVNPK